MNKTRMLIFAGWFAVGMLVPALFMSWGSLKACEDNTTASAKCGIWVCRWGTCIMRPCK